MTSVIGGELVLGERQKTAIQVVVEAVDGLQRIEQASVRGTDKGGTGVKSAWQSKSKVQYFCHDEAQQ
jgi:hypothetical protein